jgi:serpin B
MISGFPPGTVFRGAHVGRLHLVFPQGHGDANLIASGGQKKLRRKLAIITVLTGLVLGCLAALPLAREALAEKQGEPATAYTKFGFKLFGKLIAEKEQNVFISPASVAFALAMVYNGAAGETQQAMARTLEIQGLSLDALNQGNARLRQALGNPDPRIKLSLANSLWLQQGFAFTPGFLKCNEEFYGATLEVINFADPRSSAAINAWVAKATTGKITGIVDKIEPPLLLINAIYFKGLWAKPFDKALTKELPFTLLDGRQKRAPMMSQAGNYQYYRGKNFQAVSLPYGEKGRFSMKIFLPDQDSSLKEFLRELNAANWQRWLADFHKTPGSIVLPRFKLEYEASLTEPLKAMGMEVAFDINKANFAHLDPTPPGVYIGEVKHKTLVEVNEEGTEAAAVTAVHMPLASMAPMQEFTMVVDRPFFVAIDDSETGVQLFLGAVVEPKVNDPNQ